MRPPICAICGNDFREAFNEGGMIHFKIVKKYRHLHLSDALVRIKEHLS